MITIIDIDKKQILGLSTDTKPNNMPVNSLFLELDTKTLYYCAKGGSQSEEVVYEGNVADGDFLSNITFSGTATIVFDGTTYVCEPKTYTFMGKTYTNYGADVDASGEIPSHDFSEYPFCLDIITEGSVPSGVTLPYVAVNLQDKEGTHSLSISSLVTTEAEWVEYGEAPSGGGSGVTGDLSEDLTIPKTAWILPTEDGDYLFNTPYVEAPYFEIDAGNRYKLSVNGSTEGTAQAVQDIIHGGIKVAFSDAGIAINSDNTNNKTYVLSNDRPENDMTLSLRLAKS